MNSFPYYVTVLALIGLCGCRQDRDIKTITEQRTSSLYHDKVPLHASSADRFGPLHRDPQPAVQADRLLDWETPPGWKSVAPGSLHVLKFSAGPQGEATCSFSILPGQAGGVTANVNRWRRQFGLAPMKDADIAALPSKPVFGKNGVFVHFDGAYTGMGSRQPQKDYRLLGLILSNEAGTLFVKMVGPREIVIMEADHFLAFGRSLRPARHPERRGERAIPRLEPQNLTWTPPAGWHETGTRPMRLVTYTSGKEDRVECYLVALDGTGGGLTANINRWQDQMEQPPLTTEEIAELDRIPLLDTEAVVITITGHYRGMGKSDIEDAMMLGALLIGTEQSLFIKMIGPRHEVLKQRSAFDDFVRSIRAK